MMQVLEGKAHNNCFEFNTLIITMSTHLDDWIERLRSRDAMTFKEAFHEQWPTGPKLIPRLIKEMRASDDPYTRGKFVEILGQAGDNEVVADLAG